MKQRPPSNDLLEIFNKWLLEKNGRTYTQYKKLNSLPWSMEEFSFHFVKYFHYGILEARKVVERREYYDSIKEEQIKKQGFKTVYQEWDPVRIFAIKLGRIREAY